MKKIFTLLCAVLFSVQFAAAQQKLYVYSKSGDLAAYPANKVTFDDDIFAFTYGDATEITNEMFSASFKVAFKSDDYKSFVQTPEVGICFSDMNENPTIADGKIKKGSSLSTYSFSINGLDAGTTYYYRAYVKVNDAVYYGDVKSETTFGKKSTTDYKIINGHKFVDLGLPSGLLWATCNVGAVTAADDGNYYAWGETSTKSEYSSNNYFDSNYTTYSINGKTTLEKQHDAAYVNWGSSCRMPTNDEFGELLNSEYCTWTWTSMTASDGSSINGYKVTSVKNGNSIFLPASGHRNVGSLNGHGSKGYYWSSTLYSGDAYNACYLYFNSSGHDCSNHNRYRGLTVRPVAEP
jgi:hypothetical protein